MTSPTKEYIERERKVHKILEKVDIGGLETRFECSKDNPPIEDGFVPASMLPDFVAFYDNDNKMGELYFLEDPIIVKIIDSSFESYAEAIKEKYR